MKPPSHEATVALPYELSLIIQPGAPSYRNYLTGLYEVDLTRVVSSLVRPGMTFVDVGANIGYYMLLCSRLVGVGGRVYAFEPDPDTVRYLERNVALNHCTNVLVLAEAVSNKVAVLQFERPGPERGFLTGESLGGRSVAVQSTSLDEYFAQIGWPRVDLVKIDAEGSEVQVLRGMVELVSRNPGIRLIVEWNVAAQRRAGSGPDELVATLQSLGFTSVYVVELKRTVRLQALPNQRRVVYNLLLGDL